MIFRSLPIFILVFLVGDAAAQYNQTRTFTINDGMAMTECGVIYCDKSGRIWTTHSNTMISCYDGISFRRFSPQETGHFSGGAQFIENQNGLWIFQRMKSISLFDDGKWKSWLLPKAFNICIDKKSDILVILQTDGNLLRLDTSGQWNSFAIAPALPQGHEYYLTHSHVDTSYLLQIISFDKQMPVRAFTSSSLIDPNWIENPILLTTTLDWYYDIIYPESRVNLYQPFSHSDHPNERHTISYSFLGYVYYTSTPIENGSDFLVNVYLLSPTKSFEHIAQFEHPNHHILMTLDKNGNIWVGSQGGLKKVSKAILEFHEDSEAMISSLHCINEDGKGTIWFGGYETGLSYYDGKNLHRASGQATRYKRFLPGSYQDSEGSMAFWTEDYGLVVNKKDSWTSSSSENLHKTVGYYFTTLKNNQVAAGMHNEGIGITDPPLTAKTKWKFIGKDKGMLLNNVLTITEDQHGRLWCGRSSQGLALYDPVNDTAQSWLIDPSTSMNFGVESSALDARGRLWLGCNDGLRMIEDPHKFSIHTDTLENSIIKISMDEAGYSGVSSLITYHDFVIFGNAKGYGLLDLKNYSPAHSPRIFFYKTEKHCGPTEQNTFLVDSKNFVWLGHDKGATRIDISAFSFDTLPVEIVIDSIFAGSERIQLLEEGNRNILAAKKKLPTLKRYIEIFLHPSFTGALNDNVGFYYRLLHPKIDDTTWSAYSQDKHIILSYLPPGENIIQIRAMKNNQIADELELHLPVPLALSESPAFWIASIGSLSILLAIIAFFIHRQQLKLKQAQINLSEQRREKEHFQIRAIANSLNPHFIKNSLNWAQTRFRSDHKVATVIDELSSNISTIFKRSREGQAFHSLVDEFELVKNYLSIQQATYGHFLDITLPDEELIEQFKHVIVPLMQIQIHVENAIEHGIRNKTGAHLLVVEVQEEENYLHITITDDGIGRKEATALGAHGTQQGTAMLNSLYEIFNQYNTNKFSCWYEDLPLLDPSTGKKTGTRVHIRVPMKYEYQYENNSILHS